MVRNVPPLFLRGDPPAVPGAANRQAPLKGQQCHTVDGRIRRESGWSYRALQVARSHGAKLPGHGSGVERQGRRPFASRILAGSRRRRGKDPCITVASLRGDASILQEVWLPQALREEAPAKNLPDRRPPPWEAETGNPRCCDP